MRTIYTDENKRLKDFGKMIDSPEFHNFIKQRLGLITKYSYGMKRVEPSLSKKVFQEFFRANGFVIGDKSEHAHGIGNNNMVYVQDMESKEYIGAIHLNTDMYGGMFCYGTDINENIVSNSYLISERGLRINKTNSIDWNKYSFEKKHKGKIEVFNLVNKALQYGILQADPDNSNNILVVKVDEGNEFWASVSKAEAVKDLIEQDQVSLIEDAIKEMEKPKQGKLMEYKGLYFDNWNTWKNDNAENSIYVEICENHLIDIENIEEYPSLEGPYDTDGKCDIYSCDINSTDNEGKKFYYFDPEPEHIHFIDEMIYLGRKSMEEAKEAMLRPIVEQNKENGYTTKIDIDCGAINPYWDVFWYDGKLGTVENDKFEVTLYASGDTKACLVLGGKEILTSYNSNDFKKYISNDLELHELLDSQYSDNRMSLIHKNWIDFTIKDKETGEILNTEPFEAVLECNDVLTAFTEIEAFEGLYNKYKALSQEKPQPSLEEQIKGATEQKIVSEPQKNTINKEQER